MDAVNKRYNMRHEDRQAQQDKKKRILLLLLLLVGTMAVLLVAGYFAGWFGGARDLVAGDLFPGQGEGAVNGQLPGMTEEQIKQQMQQVADASKFSFKINAQPVFETGDGTGNLRIENPNHNIYPFVVDIYLTETDERIFSSGGLLPDQHIDTAKLTTVLPKGTHEATARINVYDPESNEYLGKSEVKLSIIVKN